MTVTLNIGRLRQVVSLFQAGTPVADGDGAYTVPYAALDPPVWRCALALASPKASEQHFAATVTGHAQYLLTGRYHPGITLQTRMIWTDRSGTVHTADVLDVEDPEGAGVSTVVLVSEVAT